MGGIYDMVSKAMRDSWPGRRGRLVGVGRLARLYSRASKDLEKG